MKQKIPILKLIVDNTKEKINAMLLTANSKEITEILRRMGEKIKW